jgi:hypothetical protein
VAVVVHYDLVAYTLHVEARPSGSERAEAHGHEEDSIHLSPDRHEFRRFA